MRHALEGLASYLCAHIPDVRPWTRPNFRAAGSGVNYFVDPKIDANEEKDLKTISEEMKAAANTPNRDT